MTKCFRKTSARFLLIGNTIPALGAVAALPAGADTTATLTLTAGALSISAPTAACHSGPRLPLPARARSPDCSVASQFRISAAAQQAGQRL